MEVRGIDFPSFAFGRLSVSQGLAAQLFLLNPALRGESIRLACTALAIGSQHLMRRSINLALRYRRKLRVKSESATIGQSPRDKPPDLTVTVERFGEETRAGGHPVITPIQDRL